MLDKLDGDALAPWELDPQEDRNHYRASSWLVLVLITILALSGLTATTMTVGFSLEEVKEQAEREFINDVRRQEQAIDYRLQQQGYQLRAFAQFLSANPDLDYATFDRYARAVMRDEPVLDALEWVPRVTADQRQAFEARWAEVFDGFELFTRDSSGARVPTPQREVYWPILYVSPLQGNEAVVGYAPDHVPARDRAIEQALSQGSPSLSRFISLLQGGLGVIAFQPVRGLNGDIIGLAEAVYRRDQIIQPETFLLADKGVQVTLSADDGQIVVFQQHGEKPPPPGHSQFDLPLRYKTELLAGGQVWRLTVESMRGAYVYSWLLPASIGLAGAVATLMACGLVIVLWRRQRVIAAMVERRSEMLVFQSRHDALTGMLNRRSFETLIQDSIQARVGTTGEQAVFLLDLDQFKVINDTAGHRIGDRYLRCLAERITARYSQTAHLARLGGDEFGLLHNRCDAHQAERLAEELLHLIEETQYPGPQGALRSTASIGIAMVDAASDTAQTVIASADAACFLAKERGRNRFHLFHQADREGQQYREEMAWVSEIREAIQENRLRLRAQRIAPVDRHRRDMPFHEALITLVRKDGERVPPGAFLPAAERYQLMPQLDRWVLEHVLAWMAKEKGTTRWSVNLSGQSLNDESLGDWVVDAIQRHAVDPSRLCLEITETAVVSNLALARRFIERLHAAGCSFALDDFGSGMSSFTYLKHLPVDFLKIDGSFVRDIATDPSDRATVGAIHKIARSHQIDTIAEFVESREVINVLASIGIDYMQGYYLGRPFYLEGAEQLISSKS